MEKFEKILNDIIELERENMTPILNQIGREFDSEDVLNSIAENNPGLQHVYVVYSRENKLLGYFRFNKNGENSLMIQSIQISEEANLFYVTKSLFRIAYTVLYYSHYAPELNILSWVFKENPKSISLHNRLGFSYVTDTRHAIQYSITKKKLMEKLEDLGMSTSFTPYSHPGIFPVRVLMYNISHTIENHRSDRLEDLRRMVEEGLIKPGIKYGINNERVKAIQVDPELKCIVVEEPFLAFLWSFIYSSFVIYEEGIQIPTKNNDGTFTGLIDNSREITKRAFSLFEWSTCLPAEIVSWPLNLPNPELHHSAEEQYYSEKTNDIYLKVVTFLCNHEIAHLLNNHWDVLQEIKEKSAQDRTQEEILLYQEIEGDADSYARQIMIEPDIEEDQKLLEGIAIVFSVLASFFLVKHPKFLDDQLHPDVNIRLSNSLDFLAFEEQDNRDYVDLLSYMIMHYFFKKWESTLSLIDLVYTAPTEFANPQDCLTHAFNFVDQIKIKYEELNVQ